MTRSSAAPSFRDPHGQVVSVDGRVFRLVNREGLTSFESCSSTKAYRKFVDSGRLVKTERLADSSVEELLPPHLASHVNSEAIAAVFEHEKVPFPSYPAEWPPEMLHAAGMLTLEIQLALIDEGIGLKDATPYNVLFRGSSPVFIDVLSFEQRDAGDTTWLPYAQFIRTFLSPLLANQRFGTPLDQIFLTRSDGLEPHDVYRMCGRLQRLTPPFLSLVTMPVWLDGKGSGGGAVPAAKPRLTADKEKARFILRSIIGGLKRQLGRLRPAESNPVLMDSDQYGAEDRKARVAFVRTAVDEIRPAMTMDIGCGAGDFSAIAASSGSVLAIDGDQAAAGSLWRRAQNEGLNILPLVVNLARPTPPVGWANAEVSSFLDRARGSFQMVLMLGHIHHLLVTHRIPLDRVVDLASELTTSGWVVEFVPVSDPMFARVARGREHLHADLTEESFETACSRKFRIVRKQCLQNGRSLYLMIRL